MSSYATPPQSAGIAPVPVDVPIRRRSSLAVRLSYFTDADRPNSFTNFARSWSRATQFYTQRESGSDTDHAVESPTETLRSDDPECQAPPGILVTGPHRPLESAPQASSNPETHHDAIEARLQQRRAALVQRRSYSARGSQGPTVNVFNISRHDSRERTNSLLQQHSNDRDPPPALDGAADEETPLISKHAESEGPQQPVPGQSTSAQTSFNLTNALIGMSMLAVPYGIRLSGWVIGISSFTICAAVTAYTGTLLARAIEIDPSGSLSTYDDLAYIAYGPRARTIVRVLFNLELLAVGVALVILGADCFHSLAPELNLSTWKLIVGLVVTPLCAVPMRILSVTSIFGILSSVAIIIIVLIAGLTKSDFPGSLSAPAQTSAWPEDWAQFPKAFGMLMACYGAHGIFPNFYRDMRSPHKFDRTIYFSYGFAWLIQLSLGICGYLMYGHLARNEISVNVFETKGYARWISTVIIIAMAVLPLTKIPLNAQPIIGTLSLILRTKPSVPTKAADGASVKPQPPPLRRRIAQSLPYIITPLLLVSISIFVPSFDRVLAVLGNLLCCLISVVLPCLFHLRLYSRQMPIWRKALEWTLVVLFAIPTVVGTVYSVWPN